MVACWSESIDVHSSHEELVIAIRDVGQDCYFTHVVRYEQEGTDVNERIDYTVLDFGAACV